MERNYNQPLESVIFTEEQDSKAIDHIKASKAQGPDSIQPNLIKETKLALKKPLKLLFIKSLGGEKNPNNLEKVNVTAIFKIKLRIIAQSASPQYRAS